MTNAPIHRLTGNTAGKACNGVIFARETQASQAATIRPGDPGQVQSLPSANAGSAIQGPASVRGYPAPLEATLAHADGIEIMADGPTVVNSGGGTAVAIIIPAAPANGG